jgi:Zn-dependent protease
MTDAPLPPAKLSPNGFYLVFAVLVAGAALAALSNPPAVLTFVFVCIAWVASVVFHEFGHAVVAYHAGDTSVRDKGYLSLDPLRYANWQTTLVLPLILLALGGIGFPGAAVYLREDLMRTRLGRSMASLAGPGGTLIVLLVIDLILAVMRTAGWANKALYPALAFLAFLQATALILNLLPIPGFDGYGVIRPFLPDSLRKSLKPVEGIAFLVLFLALMFFPPAGEALFGAAARLARSLGAPPEAMQAGLDQFLFWKRLAG